jgi:hypothetical protein
VPAGTCLIAPKLLYAEGYPVKCEEVKSDVSDSSATAKLNKTFTSYLEWKQFRKHQLLLEYL